MLVRSAFACDKLEGAGIEWKKETNISLTINKINGSKYCVQFPVTFM